MKKLFWVSTDFNEEDWFVIASSAKVACRFHEGFEGFDKGKARAKEICTVKSKYKTENAYHAQLDMLVDLGFKVLSKGPTRIVINNGVVFKEGTTIGAVIREQSYNKEGIYILNATNTNRYKIGITKDFNKRLSNLQTGSPFMFEIEAFYSTNKSRMIERLMHALLKNKNVGGEWFELTEEELRDVDQFVSVLSRDRVRINWVNEEMVISIPKS